MEKNPENVAKFNKFPKPYQFKKKPLFFFCPPGRCPFLGKLKPPWHWDWAPFSKTTKIERGGKKNPNWGRKNTFWAKIPKKKKGGGFIYPF
ncbi:hypothetical protein EBI_25599 [Enterocytozoon bieneusi H348]|nr:hypothetical protein EBI_25599 [Enterocytozoon bieneusi H348]|eukprot:XP_002651161.1 hypothetical protein EBI_25599 [Enterocytozoon bieneusi H348]